MKKLRLGLIRAMMLTASLLFLAGTRASADQNDFNIQVKNLTQPTDRTIEFDVYLLDTDPAQSFQLASIQLGFIINSGIFTGGNLSVTYSNIGSQLLPAQQFNGIVAIDPNPAGYPGKAVIKLSGRVPPGAGNGTTLFTAGDGNLVTHFVLTNSVPWVANQTPDLEFCSSSAINPLYATRVSQYIGTTNTPMVVTPGVNALVCCNPALNAAAPVAFSVTGTGSYCQGGAGLPVGLSGSEAGATYQLFKDGIPSGSPVPGTGSPLSFGNQTAGTYTVTGTIGSTTTPMSGSAIITETPPPAQPGDFTVSSPFVYKGSTGIVYTVPAVAGATSYTWAYTGSGATFSSTSNTVVINFSPTATSGTLSVTANNSCGPSAARTLAITVNTYSTSDYLLQVLNLTQPTDNTIEFDVYLKDTEPSIPMMLATIQLGFLLNSEIYTGGALNVSINNSTSGLLASQRFTATPSIEPALSGYPNQTLIRLAGNTPPGAGAGTTISTTGNGTLLTHFTITSTVPFTPFSLPNLTFTSSSALSPLYATRISVYLGTTNTPLEVIPGTNALVCCNPALNAGPPAAYAVIGGGAYCEGGAGLPVDLAASQVGVSYQLYKDAVLFGPAVPGTGSAISFGNQSAGTYTVTGTNTSGTTPMTGSAIITMNPLPLQPGNFSTSSAVVCQGATGVVYTVPADPTVTFAWNYSGTGATITGSGNSVTVSFSSTATSGNLSVTASNTCGTSIARTLAITVNTTPVPTITGLATVCAGTSGVVYTTEPGMTQYQWIVSPGGTVTNGGTNADNTVTVTWNIAGSQSVSVNYSNGNCTAITPTLYPVIVSAVPGAPVASVTQQPTCDIPAGTITVTSPAPAAGITFSIDGATYTNTTGIFTGVVTGTYNVTVKNAAGCISPALAVTVNAVPGAPAAPSASVTTQPTCAVATGTITVSSPAPAAGIFYSIDGITYTNTTGVFTGVPSGTYSVTYKDGSGCISSPATVTVNTAPVTPTTPVVVPTHPLCNETTGTITVTSPVPAAGLTYSIDGVTYTNTTGVFTGVVPGTYSVTVRNADGCVSAATPVTVNAAPETPAAPVTSVTQQPTCDIPTGTITITSPVPAAGITYSIDGITYTNTTGVFTGVIPGTYNVTVRNATGCVSPATPLTVNAVPGAPAAPSASVTSQPTCEVATGTITVSSPAPAAGIFYSIDGVTYTNTTGVFTGVPSGTYSVTYKDASGCISSPATVTVNAAPETPAAPLASVTSQPTCEVATGTITVTSPAPAAGISFSIDGVDYTNTSGVFTGVAPGTYNVTVKNAAGCVSAPTPVTVNAAPETPAAPLASVTSQPTCEVATGTITVTSPVPAAGISFSIDGMDYTNTSGVFTGVVPGTYNVTVKNAAGCVSAPTPVTVNSAPETPAAPLASVTSQPTCEVQSGIITITSPAPAAGITFSVDGITYTNTTGVFTGLAPGSYSVTVKNAAGCVSPAVPLTIDPIPGAPAQPGDFTAFASAVYQGTANVVFTVPADPQATSYTWSYSGNGATITGSSNSVTVSFSGTATSGTLSVVAVNGCGSSLSRDLGITVSSLLQTHYLMQVLNMLQTSPTTIEFDVFLLDTEPTIPFELASVQLGFLLNSGIYAGGTLSVAINNATSELNAIQQFTATPTIGESLAGYPGQTLIRLAGKTPPGAGNGSTISDAGNGTLLTHFILTSSVPFAPNTRPELIFTSSSATLPLYATRLSEYIGGVNTALVVTPGTNANVCCNPLLNAASPVAFNVTGSGSYCEGGPGLAVGLSGSETGVTYQLFKDGTATGTPLPGTGAAIDFGVQMAGIYTVTGTNLTGSTPMTGSAVLTVTPLPSQPGNFIASTTVVYQGATGVVYTVPVDLSVTYSWTYSGSGVTILGTGNSVTLNFSAIATSGTLSVTAVNTCGTSIARTIAITVNPLSSTDYLLQVLNLTQPTDNTIEFDVYLLDTEPSQDFQLASIQLGFLLSSDIYTGGTMTASISNATSGLLVPQQFTASPTVVSALTGYPGQTLIRLAGNPPPGAGNGSPISKTGNGTLITHFTLTSTVPWTPNSKAGLAFTSSSAVTPLYATRLSEYVGNTNTPLEIIPGTNALVCCDPPLNAGPPSAYAVIGGGSYCEGGTGLPVDLAGSQAGVAYQLFKNGVAEGTPVNGTGSSISFGNQTAGVYTVTGTNLSGTTPMTGSATIIMTPLPLQPGEFTASTSTVCQNTTGVIFTVPLDPAASYNWTYSGTGVTITGTGNSVSVTFSETAVSGNLSVTATNTCGTSIPRTVSITVNPRPAPVIAGLNSVCEGTAGVVYSTEPSMTGYQWIVTAGGTITAGGTSTDNTVTVTWTTAGSQTVSVNYSDGNCTAVSPTVYPVTVNSLPSPAVTEVIHPTCPVPTGTITVTAPLGEAGYSIDGLDYTNTSGVFTGVVPGTYSVTVRNAAACVSAPTSVTVNAAPETPAASVTIAASPVGAICEGTSVTFTATPVNGGTPTYQWMNNGIPITGQTGETYTSTTLANGDIISVVMTSSLTCVTGSPATSNEISMTVNAPLIAYVTIAASPVGAICEGTSVTFTATPINGGTPAYQWMNNGIPITGQTGETYTSTTLANGDLISVVMTSSLTCVTGSPAASNAITMTVNTVPSSPLASVTAQPTCEVATGTITVTSPAPAAGISYSIDGLDYTNTSGVFTGVLPGTYQVTVKNAAGCVSAPTSVTVNAAPETPAAPVASVTSQPTCEVATGTITVTSPVPAAGISFSIDGVDYTNTSGVFTGVVPGTYQVTVKNADGCVSAPTSVTVRDAEDGTPAQPGAFTESSDYMCAGTTEIYTVPYVPDITYSWSYTGEGATITGSGNSVSVSMSLLATSGTLSVVATNSCGTSAAREIFVTVRQLPGPAGVITGETNVCPGATGVVYTVAAIPNAVHYRWTVPSGATIVGGDDTNSITVNFSENATSGVITVQGWKNCGEGEISPELMIIVSPKAVDRPGEFTESTDYMCAGTSATFAVPNVSNVTYSWSYTGEGATITGSGNSVSVSMSLFATSGTLSVVATNSCGTSAAREIFVTVRQLPGPAGVITGETNVCPGATGVVYTVAAIPNAVHYRWTVPSGATIVGGDDTNSITVNFSENATSGIITVQGWKTCGEGEISPELNITVKQGTAGQPGEFTESSSYMCAGSSATYTVPYVDNVTYSWSYSGKGATITGSGNSVKVSFAPDATTGTLSVVAANNCGTSSPRTINVTVRQLPGPAGMIKGPEEVCQGSKAVVYSVPVIPNAVDYIWTLPSGASIVSGQNTNTITVNFSNDAESGVITVQGSKNCGTGKISPEFRVTLKPVPDAPVISFTDGLLRSDAMIGNQWYFTGNPVPNAVNDTYVPQENGSYFAVVTTGGCRSPKSNVVDVILPETGLKVTDIDIYPVPTKGDFTVTITSEVEKTIDILVFSSSGTKVHEVRNVVVKDKTELPFELNALPAGIYYLRFIGPDGQAIKTVILTR